MKQLTKVTYEQISIQVDAKLLKKMDAMAKKLNLSRSQFIRNCIETGFGDAVMLNSIGLLSAIGFGRKFITGLKKGIANGDIDFDIDKDGDLKIKNKDKKE